MNKFGPLSLILGVFLPVLNISSFMAGVNSISSSRFIVYNIVSAVLWCGILLALGFFVGNIPEIEAYLDVITDIFLVIIVAIVVIVILMSIRDSLPK
jgi:membrane-associated protein